MCSYIYLVKYQANFFLFMCQPFRLYISYFSSICNEFSKNKLTSFWLACWCKSWHFCNLHVFQNCKKIPHSKCSCELWTSLGMWAKISCRLLNHTLAIFRGAKLSFLGVLVGTREYTPCFWGHWSKAQVWFLCHFSSLPCWIDSITNEFRFKAKNGILKIKREDTKIKASILVMCDGANLNF